MYKTNHKIQLSNCRKQEFKSLSTKDINFKTKILSTNEFTEIRTTDTKISKIMTIFNFYELFKFLKTLLSSLKECIFFPNHKCYIFL